MRESPFTVDLSKMVLGRGEPCGEFFLVVNWLENSGLPLTEVAELVVILFLG
jgi:hypothetical protein